MKRLILSGSSRCGTTITCDYLIKHPDVYLTNELRIYYNGLIKDNPVDYYNIILSKYNKPGYHRIPDIEAKSRLIECIANANEEGIYQRIINVENAVFNGFNGYIGDKGVSFRAINAMDENDVDYKLIYIYRDGRDVAYSGYLKSSQGAKPPWSQNMAENAEHWAMRFKTFLDLAEGRNWLGIRFEDFINKPGKNSKKISEYLGIDQGKLITAEKSTINKKRAHLGHHKNNWPNWKNDSSELFLSVLDRLNYI